MSDSTPDGHQVDVNLSRIRQIAETGVNRASLFMGFALNAADREDVIDCSLHSQTPMAPKTGRPADMECFRSEFKRWIVHCGFRELIEAFNLFLDGIHQACCVMALSKSKMTSQDMRKRINSVKGKGLPGKHRDLMEQFGVSTQYIDDFMSVSKARNCLAHNMGVVTDRDVGDDGNLVLTWHGAVDLVVRDVHGDPHVIGFGTEEAITLESPSLHLEAVERRKEFAAGQPLDLSAQDVGELCTCARLASREIIKKVHEYATGIGINVVINQDRDEPRQD